MPSHRAPALSSHVLLHTTQIAAELFDICSQLHPLLATHAADPDPRASVCIHLDGYGTCSSTVLAYSHLENRYIYTFAPGSPCRNIYSDVDISPAGGQANHHQPHKMRRSQNLRLQ